MQKRADEKAQGTGWAPAHMQPINVTPGEEPKGIARVREAVIDRLFDVKAAGSSAVKGFRSSTNHFKYKAAIVAGWILLSGAALGVACPSVKNSGQASAIQASVTEKQGELLGRKFTALIVENTSKKDWSNVTIRVDQTWSVSFPFFGTGEAKVIDMSKFVDAHSRSAPETHRPAEVTIETSEGRGVVRLR